MRTSLVRRPAAAKRPGLSTDRLQRLAAQDQAIIEVALFINLDDLAAVYKVCIEVGES